MESVTKKKMYIAAPNKFRIFQIGFNKCGTRTIFKFFQQNGVESIHYDKGQIARSMFRHHRRGESLIDIRYRNVTMFADMEDIFKEDTPLYAAEKLYKQLDRQCKNSKFILNTRDKDNWIKSRILHGNGKYLNYIANKLSISKSQLIDKWKQDWDSHHLAVIDYFRNRPSDLLVFNIETDPIDRLINFFYGILKLNPIYYQHRGKSSNNIDHLDKETNRLYNENDKKEKNKNEII